MNQPEVIWILYLYFSYNEYDWCPLDIAIMLNNIPMIQLLVQYGAEESQKSTTWQWIIDELCANSIINFFLVQPEECRYESVCHQLAILYQQNPDESTKKTSSNKLTTDDVQVCLVSELILIFSVNQSSHVVRHHRMILNNVIVERVKDNKNNYKFFSNISINNEY